MQISGKQQSISQNANSSKYITQSNSLVLNKNNSNKKNSGYCGSLPLLGPKNSEKGFHVTRIFCKTNGCPICWPIKLAARRREVRAAAEKFRLNVFVTLTIDPKNCSAADSPKYIQKIWNRYRSYRKRKFGKQPDFISILEFTKKGYAHLHVLLNEYTPWAELNDDWKRLGGGHVDVKAADKNSYRYLAKYLSKRIAETEAKGARLINSSRSIKLKLKNPNPEYKFHKIKYENLKSTFKNSITSEAYFNEIETGFYLNRPITFVS